MNKDHHPFMIAVQFHPERLEKNNQISRMIKSSFYHQKYNR